MEEMVIDNPKSIEWEDKTLTRIKPNTKFYMDARGRMQKNPKVLALIKIDSKKDRNKFITKLIKRGRIESVDQLRENRYGDLLLVK